jgi:capsular polysaccharide biosynthesis protein
MDREERENIFEAIEFIFRHPWVVLSAIVIIMSIVTAQLSFTKLIYSCQALVSFETTSEETKSLQDTVNRLIQRVLMGESIREIIKEAWPEIDEKKYPKRYEGTRNWLRSRNGINMAYGQKAGILTISLKSQDPRTGYTIVQATINSLKRENKKSAVKRIDMDLSFLKEQLGYYRDKVKSIDEEISAIKTELREKSGELSERDRILIGQVTGESDFALHEQAALQKLAKYDEKLVDLDLQLLGEEKRKKRLLETLESGEPIPIEMFEHDFSNDVYIREYSRIIANKQLEIASLGSQGYLNEHPGIRKLKGEIEALEELKERRLTEIRGETETRAFTTDKREAELKIKAQLRETELKIETLKDKIDLLNETYKKDTESAFEKDVSEASAISAQASRLKELNENKKVSGRYLDDIRRKLEEAQLKSRTEEAEAGLNIIVVEEPKIPSSPMPFQKTQKLLFGFLVSIFVGCVLAYVIDSMDTSVKTASELRALLKIPVLGSIDRINTISEMRLKSLQRKAIVIGWVIFALSSKILLKIFF